MAGCPSSWGKIIKKIMNIRRKFSMKHWIIGRLLRSSIRDSALQDFNEQFAQIRKRRGTLIATLWFGVQVLSLFPSAAKDSLVWSTAMLKNYFRIALRNIRRHKGYSFLNIAGLAIGMACVVLILLWIRITILRHTNRILSPFGRVQE